MRPAASSSRRNCRQPKCSRGEDDLHCINQPLMHILFHHLGSATPPDHSVLVKSSALFTSAITALFDWIAHIAILNIFRFLLTRKIELTTACDYGSVRQFIRIAGLRPDKSAINPMMSFVSMNPRLRSRIDVVVVIVVRARKKACFGRHRERVACSMTPANLLGSNRIR
ncbi:hypothetical protein KC357_g45 [Hortaea werneckii]|nr:hypothetical protein KC357_g45 [Hortaea werneckii]